jgi:chemotaxis protein MotA
LNITLIFGIIASFGLTLYGIMAPGTSEILWYYDQASVIITVGGSIMATLAQTPLSDIKNLGKWLKIAFFPPKFDARKYITEIVEYATIARSKGLLALEESANAAADPFMKQALMLVVDANDPEKVRSMLEDSLDAMEERHQAGVGFFATGVSMAPAFGMIGTLVGLVAMLQTMQENPDELGANMAVAIITTFYGSLLSNCLFAPLESALKNANANEVFCKTLIIEGVLSIASGSNPRTIQEKLEFMLPPASKKAWSAKQSR